MFSKILFVLAVSIIGSAMAGCDLNGNWASACKSPQMVSVDGNMKNAILDTHNKFRNDIALGKIQHYDKAANMQELQWDDNLAKEAAKNVHQCEMKHDQCAPGQNLAYSMWSGGAQKDTGKITQMVTGWFDEQKIGGKYGWMDNIKQLKTIGSGKDEVGHFTQIVQAKATKIGCAISTSKTNQNGQNYDATWLACDYSNGNLMGAPVYASGNPASQCKNGKSNKYPGLCK